MKTSMSFFLLCMACTACVGHRGPRSSSLSTTLHQFVSCLDDDGSAPRIEPDQDLVVLVHGCNSSIAKFKNISQVFESRGQQAVCFTYDDRDSLVSVANELDEALFWARARLGQGKITVIGHSQGGLIARQAATVESDSAHEVTQLVTISTPFSGIRSAHDCGLMPLHIFSFGLTVAVCQAIAGRKWTEIHDKAPFIVSPPPLDGGVERHLAIRTDERRACRRFDGDSCVDRDYVFSLSEQSTAYVADPRLETRIVVAGHAAVVGEEGNIPSALIDLLEREHVLRPLPFASAAAQTALLRKLYRKTVSAR